jgi:arylsulfatase A-like enzyme
MKVQGNRQVVAIAHRSRASLPSEIGVRTFLRFVAGGAACAGLFPAAWAGEPAPPKPAATRPNVVIVLADDMGWRDTGYQGSPYAKTPHLDALAAGGVRFDYFYAGQQMCSPGRFAIMTGRTPLRCGIPFLDPIRPQEITIAKALKTAGYATGHFGKWHLGSGPVHPTNMGFDISWYSPNFFDTGGKLTCGKETVTVTGDSSVFTMDLAIDWIRKQAGAKKPFFAYVCFGSPHDPHKGADEFKALYKDVPVPAGFQGSFADFYAEISGLDAAVGKLRSALRELTIADNTLVWFTSDNGGIKPFSKDPAGLGKGRIGVRTVACLEWPARVKSPIRTDCACVHMDMYPTILDIAGVTMPHQPVLDGISLVPLLDRRMTRREKPMGFLSGPSAKELPNTDFIAGTSAVWIDGNYKLSVPGGSGGKGGLKLADIYADPSEKTDLSGKQAELAAKMRADLDAWRRGVRDSYDGKDFAGK